MKVAVVYQSRTGHTKSVAESIADALGVQALDVKDAHGIQADVILLGSGVYAAQLDESTKAFIDSLNSNCCKKVALYGTSAGGRKPFGMMAKRLERKGLVVDADFLYIPGAWAFLNKGRPNADDLKAAAEWAVKVAKVD